MTYYGPDEPYETILLERYFMAGDLICGLGLGMFLAIFLRFNSLTDEIDRQVSRSFSSSRVLSTSGSNAIKTDFR